MTEKKQFTFDRDTIAPNLKTPIVFKKGERLSIGEVLDKLNELYEEKEDWKNKCLNNASENSILWNEISILMKQGAEPSDAFQQYLDSISTEYDKFWQRKLKKARKDRVI